VVDLGQQVRVKCEICGKEETKPSYRAKKYRTCSNECRAKLSSKTLSSKVCIVCLTCGKDFFVKRHSADRRKTCSKACDHKRRETMYRGEANPNYKNRGPDSPLFKDGVRISNYGYVLIYNPDHPNARSDGYILEHRLVVSEHLGRPLEDWELVHHKDENKQNNDIDNLEIMTLAEHQKHHNSLKEIIRGENGRIVGMKKKDDAL
jgi:hypothetical protein